MKAARRGIGLGASLALHGLVAALLILWPEAESPPRRVSEPKGLAIIYEGPQEGEGNATPPKLPEVAEAPPIPAMPPPPPMPAAAPALEPLAPHLVEAKPHEEPRAPEPPLQLVEAPPPQLPVPVPRASPRPDTRQASASPVRLNAALQGMEGLMLEGQTSAPEPLDATRNRRPNYPEASRRRNEQGIVRLELRVDTTGRVAELHVLESSGFNALDMAALEAVRQWRFRPAQRGGLPVAASITTAVHFRLETARR